MQGTCPNCGADETRLECLPCASFGPHGGPCAHGVRILFVDIGPTARNGFVNGTVVMSEAASTDGGYAALVAAVAPAMLVDHRSYAHQWDGTYSVTVTVHGN